MIADSCQNQFRRGPGGAPVPRVTLTRSHFMRLRAQPAGPLQGNAAVPGDKSISHRALLLAAMAVGRSEIEGLLEGSDVLATAAALRELGVAVARDMPGRWRVDGVGVGGLAEPDRPLDFGNAGTGARLTLGLLAGHPFTTFVTGDDSLRARPMGRVVEPLARMGAAFVTRSGTRLPLAITGSTGLLPQEHRPAVASAQVKSAILLAGLHAAGTTSVIEAAPSRDHTERMLRAFGATLEVEPLGGAGRIIRLEGEPELAPCDVQVPGDPSSAAFPLVATLLSPGSEVRLDGCGLNPLRIGLLTTLEEMGAQIEILDRREQGGEPVADLLARGGPLRAVRVSAERAPRMIDEYPIVAVAAAGASGSSRFEGLAELRVKESDRLAAIAAGLAACGVGVEIDGDALVVHGSGETPPGGAALHARHDHRIAMAFLVLGGVARRPVEVAAAETIETSFPGFVPLMNGLGAAITEIAE